MTIRSHVKVNHLRGFLYVERFHATSKCKLLLIVQNDNPEGVVGERGTQLDAQSLPRRTSLVTGDLVPAYVMS